MMVGRKNEPLLLLLMEALLLLELKMIQIKSL